jgi:ribosomal protein S18 acetylase RimI-like enzyme
MWKKINHYDDIAVKVTAQFHRGMCTNCLLRREDYLREIQEGRLYAADSPNGLLILRQREGYDRLQFYLQESLDLPVPEFPHTTVLEIAARTRDRALLRADRYWERAGFGLLFSRRRMTREASEPPEVRPERAGAADFNAVRELMQTCFHPLAGCQLTETELNAALSAGQILCVRDERGTVCGILHYHPGSGKTGSELRHLAVRADQRRKGHARRLFAFYQAATDGQKSHVWVRSDNTAAIQFYESCGYAPDGWSSTVRVLEKEG